MPEWVEDIRPRLSGARLSSPDLEAVVEELSQHLEARYADLVAGGAAEDEARRLTLEELGDDTRLEDLLRTFERPAEWDGPALGERRRRHHLVDLVQDLRYGVRALQRNRGFTAAAILTLALGIGANTAIFTVVNAVLLRPLPYREPDRLVMLFEKTREFSRESVAYPNFRDWRLQGTAFAGLAAYRSSDFNLTGAGQPERLLGEYVSAALFDVLGIRPAIGRSFTADEDRDGGARVVMLSHGLWRRLYDGNPDALGRSLRLNGMSYTIVGVAPEAVRLSQDDSVFLPVEQWSPRELNDRASHPGLRVVGRLREGVTLDQARQELSAISARLARDFPRSNAGHDATMAPLKEDIVGATRPRLWLLLGAVALLLAIACANVTNLMLARATGRRRELAIRTALGAERGRIVRQLLAESVLLSAAASGLGLALAVAGTRLALRAVPNGLPRMSEIALDREALFFTVAVSMLTGLLTGLIPALRAATADPAESLKEGGRSGGGGRRHAEGVFVAVEVGLAVVLLVGAGLLVQTVSRLLRVDPGFSIGNILTARVVLSHHVVTSPAAIRGAYQEMLDGVAALPGVQATAITTQLPLEDGDAETSYWLGSGPQPSRDQTTSAMFSVTTPGYLRALGIPLRRGRFFTGGDTVDSKPVVVVDEVLARRVFAGQDPIGRTLSIDGLGAVAIVGVVGHVKAWGLDADDTARIRDQIYFPFQQVPDKYMGDIVSGLFITTRTSGDPRSLIAALRQRVAGRMGDQPAYEIRTMEEMASRSVAERRFTMLLLLVFAGSALFLSAIGVYGVVSYAVGSRTHELGVRAALGASRRRLVQIVMRQGMVPALAGTVGGLAAAWALSGSLSNVVYGVRTTDPATFAAVPALLLAVALAACLVPARRVARLDPTRALRQE